MTVAKFTVAEILYQCIEQYMDNHYCLELLRFFGGYPHARFSELAIIHALNSNCGRLDTKRALKQLVASGVVSLASENNISLYSLTEEKPLRSLALDLGKLDWRQWQLVYRQTYLSSRGRESSDSTSNGY